MAFVPPYNSNALVSPSALGRGYGINSNNGQFSLVLTVAGDLHLINNAGGAVVWADNDHNIAFVRMQVDGNCVGYTANGGTPFATGTNGVLGPYSFVCQDDGHVAVVTAAGGQVWVRP
ncbi:hypothetical protein D9757_013130 [Collybiopsis confluens]|uniref:Bulb-type lectin domain-containing protein n=1 Tax=Collybiopsis confluens TaxID=2823264 RepID=A0A8H5GSV4_9AGAR|nr:hypothetical protein D9757_013130 [Collybiopsis confluens]